MVTLDVIITDYSEGVLILSSVQCHLGFNNSELIMKQINHAYAAKHNNIYLDDWDKCFSYKIIIIEYSRYFKISKYLAELA